MHMVEEDGDLPSLGQMAAQATQLLEQLNVLSQAGSSQPQRPVVLSTSARDGSSKVWPPRKKTLEEEDEERYGCSWPELDEKLRFHLNWEVFSHFICV